MCASLSAEVLKALKFAVVCYVSVDLLCVASFP